VDRLPLQDIRLIASDLDGTLLNSQGELSVRNAAALEAAQLAGLVVVLITGRPVRLVLPLARELALSGHVICANGAATYRLPGGEIEDVVGIAPEVLQGAIPRLRASVPGIGFALEYGDVVIRERALRDDPDSVPDILDAVQQRPLLKLIARAPELDTHALNDRINLLCTGILDATSSGASFSEVAANGANKGFALARLCGLLGVQQHEIMAFGDAHNDLPLLAQAGVPVAVGNAVLDLKQAALLVTGSNDEDGVAQVIERVLESR
jgi:hydroxymethylpyrimidine pyrophosphatase-like HAD family hydrolase